jgi:hypothetical protein
MLNQEIAECDSVDLAETQDYQKWSEDLVIPSHSMRKKSKVANIQYEAETETACSLSASRA